MLQDFQITQIANLAKLQIPVNKKSILAQELNNILTLVEQLQTINTTGISPMAHPLDLTQRLRPDKVLMKNQQDSYNADNTQDGYYLVPKVL